MNLTDEQLKKYSIRVLDRAVQVLLCFVEDVRQLTIDEITARTGIPKSTTYRVLATLQLHGLINREPDGDAYALGSTIVLLGAKAIRDMDLPRKVRPYLEALMQATSETTHLALLTQQQVVVVDKIDSTHPIRLVSTVGFRSPLHCTGVGKVLLAHQPAELLDRLLASYEWRAYTPNTITDPAQFRAALAMIRDQDYALDWEEFQVGLRCVAAPVRDYSGEVVAAVSVSGPSNRVTAERVPELAATLLEQTAHMSEALGYKAVPAIQPFAAPSSGSSAG